MKVMILSGRFGFGHEMAANAVREEFERQGGVAFLLVSYTNRDEMYYIPFAQIHKFYQRAAGGGRKSFAYEEVDRDYQIYQEGAAFVHYLPALKKDLEGRD